MHAGDAGEFRFEMRDRAKIRIVLVQITESPPEECEQFGLVVIGFGANLNQLDKIRSGLGAQIILANPAEGIFQRHFRKRVKVGFAATRNLDLHLKKQIELTGKRTFRPARTFRDCLDAA